MKQTASVKSTDRLYFPENIEFRRYDDGTWLVVFVHLANWIVLSNDFQRMLLDNLILGKNIGEVFRMASSDDEKLAFNNLLAALFARSVARTDGVPECQVLDSSKMLNCYLTNACNLTCEHCFMNAGKKLSNELKLDEWKRILTEFHTGGGKSVTFTGGEPIMNPDFAEIVRFSYDLGLSVTVLSNGLLWDERLIKSLAPFLSEVQISVDGVDERSNSKVRGKGGFSKAVQTIISLANAGVRTSVATTFTFDNLSAETASLYKSMVEGIRKACNANPVFFKLSKKLLQGRNTSYSDSENRRYYKMISEIESYVEPGATFNNFMEGHTPGLVARNCGFGGLSIAADGEVYFCNRISEVESYGNVREASIDYFLEYGKQLYEQTSVDVVVPCKSCHLRYICSGGCRIDDFNFRGHLKNHTTPIIREHCTEDFVAKLERKMIESYKYLYTFK